MQNLKAEITYLSTKNLTTNYNFKNYQIHLYCISFTFFSTHIMLFTLYIGLYIVNFDELQTNMLQTKWKVLASINMMDDKVYIH